MRRFKVSFRDVMDVWSKETDQQLRETLKTLGMRQLDAAHLFDVKRRTVSGWVNGRAAVPRGVQTSLAVMVRRKLDRWEVEEFSAPRMLLLLSGLFLPCQTDRSCSEKVPSDEQVAKTKRSPARTPGCALRSINHAEEFLPRQRIVTEAAQHSAGDEVCVRLMHAARGHAVMRRL
jgi:hypothetical protein